MVYDHTQRIEVDKDIAIRPYTQDDVEDLFPRIVSEKESLFMIDSIGKLTDVASLRVEIDRVNGFLGEGKRLGGAVEWGGRIVGSCRISGVQYGVAGDLGYWLFEEARGKGLVTRCGEALIEIGFSCLNFQRVTISAAPSNERSTAVAKRLGMEFVRVNKKRLFRGGQWWDAAAYMMTRERWAGLKASEDTIHSREPLA